MGEFPVQKNSRCGGSHDCPAECASDESRSGLHGLLPSADAALSDVYREDFRKIELIRALGPERLRGSDLSGDGIPLEVVLHIAGDGENGERIYLGFEDWCDEIGVEVLSDRVVGGLSFINARADDDTLDDLIKFPFLRLARRMPKLSFRPVELCAATIDETFAVEIEHDAPLSDRARVAILDGGLPEAHPFGSLVNRREPASIGAPSPYGLTHGVQVTPRPCSGRLRRTRRCRSPSRPLIIGAWSTMKAMTSS